EMPGRGSRGGCRWREGHGPVGRRRPHDRPERTSRCAVDRDRPRSVSRSCAIDGRRRRRRFDRRTRDERHFPQRATGERNVGGARRRQGTLRRHDADRAFRLVTLTGRIWMRRWVIAALVMMAAGRPLAGAQVERATISGVVREGNAARPGVTVRATHVLLETATEAQTDQNGRFEIPNLRPGPYIVSVSAG